MSNQNNINFNSLYEDHEVEQDEIELLEEDLIYEPFDPNLIRVDTRPLTIDLVLKRIKFNEIDLSPKFQRQDDIWTPTAESRLIESILIRIPLPAFYMDATNDNKWLIIDGKQRLSTLKKFAIDKTLTLQNLEFLTHLKGKKYDELPRNYQRRIEETYITVYLIDKGTPPDFTYNIFRRINTLGVPLSPQELRHALNPGQATEFLDKLAKSEEFKTVTNITKARQKRMDDHEFVLGFIAFYLMPYETYLTKHGRDYFLNEAMIRINKMTQDKLYEIEDKFKFAIMTAYSVFDKYSFRKIFNDNQKMQPINKALFEVWSVTFSKLNKQEAELLKQRKDKVINEFIKYIEQDEEFVKSISQAADKVNYRFQTIEKIVRDALL
ncbi:DUF262 domain-containing protein [Nostoc sp. FACHB-190]|uniref:DUF262 domain-containing protein n=1 Tax=Nostoc sp. FACHB-190 TaxID=2692838 RepID=UPI00168956A4|nr:DUF262 domain-containing protein [Nostoc sp. FACHB-190]MBD2299893.1 DUF262 domain-containing protein [Nostoc sp. FACHB-190]